MTIKLNQVKHFLIARSILLTASNNSINFSLRAAYQKTLLVASIGLSLVLSTTSVTLGQQAIAPAEVRVDTTGRNGVKPSVIPDDYRLSELNIGDERPVFGNCDDGDFYLGFQLFYDLGDKNTQVLWEQTLVLALLKNGVEQWRDTLRNDMATQLFIETVFHDQTIKCTDNYSFRLVDKISIESTPQDHIFIRVRLYKKDQDIYNPYQSFTVNAVTGTHDNEFSIDWSDDGVGIEEYEVQWVFIDSLDGFNGSTISDAFEFKQGVSVITAARRYKHQAYYPGGTLYFRVRSFGVNPDYPNYKIPGQWQYCTSSFPLANHNADMSWQVVNSFAEGGKTKNVMNYIDGGMRQRQLLTNLNTDENILIAESLYDFEGRPVVSILPTPFKANDLNYREDFNRFDESNGWDLARKFHYDNNDKVNSHLDSAIGAAAYYSANSSFDEINTTLIPRAEGLAYTQARYLNDNTGRMNSQSGVGTEFNIDTGRNTKYFYAEATGQELSRLFGSNVGNTKHYRKSAVMDPNGQVSITYVDQEGRTIATALAGESPVNLDTLSSLRLGDWSNLTVDISDKKYEEGDGLTHSHKILNTSSNTVYDFTYNLSALADNSSEFGCIECYYDLEISITSPNGKLLQLPAIAGNESSDDRYFRIYNFSADNCSIANSTGEINISGIVFSEIGEYNIIKKLKARELDLELLETVILSDPAVQQEIEEIRNAYPLDSADCEFCYECDQDSIISATIGEVAYMNSENIYNQIVEDLRSNNTSDTVYTPTEDEIRAHELYCKYEFYVKNAASDSLESELALVKNWNEAVAMGYSNLLGIDPFFNKEGLSGVDQYTLMEGLLDYIYIVTISYDIDGDGKQDGEEEIGGPIEEVIDYNNTLYYINDYGLKDPSGYHILYREIQLNKNNYTTEEYNRKLDEQKWTWYKTLYLEQKRRLKLTLSDVISCDALMAELSINDNSPTTKEGIREYGSEMGVYGPVDDVQVGIFVSTLEQNCGAAFSTEDSIAVAGHLQTYFDRDTTDLLEFIDEIELAIDTNLIAISNILDSYNCGLEEFAIQNPIACANDTTIEIINRFQGQNVVALAAMDVSPVAMSSTSPPVNSMNSHSELMDMKAVTADNSNKPALLATAPMFYGDGANSMDSILIKQMQIAEEEVLERIRQDNEVGPGTPAETKPTKEQFNSLDQIKGEQIQSFQPIPGKENSYLKIYEHSFNDQIKEEIHRERQRAIFPEKISLSPELTNEDLISPATKDVQTGTGIELPKEDEAPIIMMSEGCSIDSTPSSEIAALKQLYDLTNGDAWDNNSGWKDGNGDFDTLNITNWYGITLDACGYVGGIEFSNNNLTDSVDLWTLLPQLSHLKVLNLDEWFLHGSLPDSLTKVTSLEHLVIFGNKLGGEIPSDINNLSSLKELVICGANLRGDISISIGDLINLKWLKISTIHLSGVFQNSYSLINRRNSISGQIPGTLANLSNLEVLVLTHNGIGGEIPDFFSSLPNLEILDLGRNNLEGELPPSISSLTKLKVFDVSKRYSGLLDLTGPQPDGPFTLYGDVSNMFMNMDSLSLLGLAYNRFTGTLPELASKVKINLTFDNNYFTGGMPASYWDLLYGHISFRYNQLDGKIDLNIDNVNWDTENAQSAFWMSGNKLTFDDALPFATQVHSFYIGLGIEESTSWIINDYLDQDSVDTADTLILEIGQPLVLTTDIDRNTEPKCKYQWFKDGVAINELDTAGHTITIPAFSPVDAGAYHYIITNDSLPPLTLTSRVKTVEMVPCNATRQQQIEALIQLYELTNRGDTTWTNNNWKVAGQFDTANVANWHGVFFNAGGDVNGINLANNNLIGNLTNWDKVSNLCQLESIIFQADSLYGNLPDWDISMLTKLETLNLYHNKLSGNLNEWAISSLKNLNYLNLTLNRISGDLTQFDLNSLPGLTEFQIGSNQLTGNIGSWNPTSQSLRILVASGNGLSGAIESLELSDLPNLSSINLGANPNINGDISQFNVSVVPRLMSINLTSCNIGGDITTWVLDSLELLDYLALGNNNISGDITAFDLSNNLNLRILYLYNNNLSGCLANWNINYLTNLEVLYLNGNTFTCELTDWNICGLTSLRSLYLRNTSLTGNIQDWNINCVTSLQYLDLGDNLLTGQIDLWNVSSLASLRILYIDNNQIAGSINGWNISGLTSFRYFRGQNNLIAGQIHEGYLNGARNMVYLDLSGNAIEGDLGQWDISQWTDINTIRLNNNLIAGDITPWRIGTLSNLTILDVSDNDISGDITQCGIENLTRLKTLDFDNNYLEGDITKWNIGNLRSLETLGLDSSRLTGTIDSIEFENLTALRNLHLTGSKVYGNLDSAGVANFSNLTSLKLIGNNLSGNLNNWPQAAGMNTIQIDSNAFTFTGLLPFVLNASVPNLSYIPQDSVDVERNIYATSGSAILATNIDKFTTPRSKFQWYKNGIAISTLDTANYEFELNEVDQSSYGVYHYIITNDTIPGLILTSRAITLLPDTTYISYNFCMEYDMQNPSYVDNYSADIDLDAAVQACLENQQTKLDTIVSMLKEKLIEEKLSSIYSTYHTNCLGKVTETLNYTFAPKEYHYTLYYYDQAGNLAQTVPPKGVRPNADSEPAHELITRYKYNSLNQLIWQTSPDGGDTYFWYDRKGQLRFSQNAEQLLNNKYSYTKYDGLGRIREVGEMLYTGMLDNLVLEADSADFPEATDHELNDITSTYYDLPAEGLISSGFAQRNLRNRVSYVSVMETESSDSVLTFYSYDAHGNVDKLLQKIPGLGEKRIDYLYDLISGNVNYIMYQFGKPDQFIHRYEYDADNRLEVVETSHDGYIWNRDAKYYYYPHGPLARIEIGEYNVQGLDYYYTLQGWLKGVNMPISGDPGDDGSLTAMTGKDEFAFQLGYYDGDYAPIGTGIVNPGSRDKLWSNYFDHQNTQGLYNGNIAWMATQLPEAGRRNDDGERQGYQAMLYHYDQLNRIMASNSLTDYTAATGFGSRSAENEAYDTRYTYDPNGNLLTLQRYNQQGGISHDYNYTYFAGTNRLQKVVDEYVVPVPESKTYNTNPLVPDGQKYKHIILDSGAVVPTGNTAALEATESIIINPGTFIESGATFTASIVSPDTVAIPPEGQYLYDEIGNLVRDNAEGVSISWTPYGKVRRVTKDNGDVINFTYDAAGNRVAKEVITSDTTLTTRYIRDASGNVLAMYENDTLKSQPIYGSSRLGMYTGGNKVGARNLGNKHYELTNHLGNVLAVVTDNINIDDSQVTASVTSVSDYYPFGSEMPGRMFNSTNYRFGFNGKMKDDQGEFGGTHYDYGFRIYSPAIGRFLSVDPLTKEFPFYSPYQFAANMPIVAVDVDGLEAVIKISGSYWLNRFKTQVDDGNIDAAIRTAFISATNISVSDLNTEEKRRWARENWRGERPGTLNYSEDLGPGSVVVTGPDDQVLFAQFTINVDEKWYDPIMERLGKFEAGGGGIQFYYDGLGNAGNREWNRKGIAEYSMSINDLLSTISAAKSSSDPAGSLLKQIGGLVSAQGIGSDVGDLFKIKRFDKQKWFRRTFELEYYYEDTIIKKSDSTLRLVNQIGGISPKDHGKASLEMLEKYEIKDLPEGL